MMLFMRTTLTLDRDVATRVRKAVSREGRPFKQVVNAALRLGLERLEQPAQVKPYRTIPRAMGLRAGLSYDDVSELLARAEGEDHR